MLFNNNENSYKNLFGYNTDENLVPIILEGKSYLVPNSICLLRALHYICLKYEDYTISLRKHCWNGICENCTCKFKDEQLGEAEGLSCQMEVEPNLEIIDKPITMV